MNFSKHLLIRLRIDDQLSEGENVNLILGAENLSNSYNMYLTLNSR
jgi:hypothetical protein